jgi:hypothetical protein
MCRPPFRPSEEQRTQVSVLRFAGWSHERIAAVIGIAPGTLRQHFSDELENGAARLQSEILVAAAARARSGSTAAAKLLMESRAAKRRNRKPPVGKKEAQQQAANTAGEGTDWGSDLMVPGWANGG